MRLENDFVHLDKRRNESQKQHKHRPTDNIQMENKCRPKQRISAVFKNMAKYY